MEGEGPSETKTVRKGSREIVYGRAPIPSAEEIAESNRRETAAGLARMTGDERKKYENLKTKAQSSLEAKRELLNLKVKFRIPFEKGDHFTAEELEALKKLNASPTLTQEEQKELEALKKQLKEAAGEDEGVHKVVMLDPEQVNLLRRDLHSAPAQEPKKPTPPVSSTSPSSNLIRRFNALSTGTSNGSSTSPPKSPLLRKVS